MLYEGPDVTETHGKSDGVGVFCEMVDEIPLRFLRINDKYEYLPCEGMTDGDLLSVFLNDNGSPRQPLYAPDPFSDVQSETDELNKYHPFRHRQYLQPLSGW